MGNSFGTLFRISTWGESHGVGVGVVIDGCPPRIPITREEIQAELDRRRPGQSRITTPRKEADSVEILSGVYQGKTLGTPLALLVRNKDHDPSAYDAMRDTYRPSHADYTYQAKFGFRNPEGGGRSSARETIGRVAAGALARKILGLSGVTLRAFITRIHDIEMGDLPDPLPALEAVEATAVRCPDLEAAEKMIRRIKAMRNAGDSVGGVIQCRVRGLPPGLGAPVFDRLEADLAKAMLSLPATKGFEVGSGFAGTYLTGSGHNDLFEPDGQGGIRTATNRSGGVQGGITNGEDLYFNVAFKPTATIRQAQATVDASGQATSIEGKGRHDPCVVPRAVPIVESMAALVLIDHWMRHQAQTGSFPADGAQPDRPS
ncbi:MAG: chorismate synthase [Opitutales bacterium]